MCLAERRPKVTTIRGMTWDHPRGYRGLEAASDVYAQERSVAVSWDRRSLQAFADAPIARLAEAYDLIVLDNPHVGMIAEQGCLLPLPVPADASRISLGGSLESYAWAGALWAYPIDAACHMAVMRPDLCSDPRKPGLPDWESVFDATPRDHRLVTPLLPVDAFCTMMTLVASYGETLLPHSQQNFTSKANGLRALRILKALYRLGPSEAVGWNPIHVLEALSTTDEFATSPCLFGYINYAKPGFRPSPLTYCDLPRVRDRGPSRGILGGAGIGVSARSRSREAALDFAAWVASEPVQSGVYIDNEGQPAHAETWRRRGDDTRFAGFLQGGHGAMTNAWTRPRDPWFLDFVDGVCEIWPDFFLKDVPEETFLARIDTLYRHHSSRARAA